MEEQLQPRERRIPALRNDAVFTKSNNEIKHPEIFELEDPIYWYGGSDASVENYIQEVDKFNDLSISKTRSQENSTPSKAVRMEDNVAFTPPKRISSLPNSPTNLGDKGADMRLEREEMKMGAKKPVRSPERVSKSVKFSEEIIVLDELPQSWDDVETEYDPEIVFIKGLTGTCILIIYLKLLLISSLCSPLLSLLASIHKLAEAVHFRLVCFSLKKHQAKSVAIVGIAVVLVLTVGCWVLTTAMLFVVSWLGLLLYIGWWVLVVVMEFVQGSEVFVEHWVHGGRENGEEMGRWR